MKDISHNCIVILLFVSTTVSAQVKRSDIQISFSIPVQAEFQEEVVSENTGRTESGRAVNFGFRTLLHKNAAKQITISAGLGYFRERFNITRSYNHSALNQDSFLVLKLAKSYTYKLMEIPIGVNFQFTSKLHSAGMGVSYIPAFCFSSYYEGIYIPGANQTNRAFSFFSHSVLLSGLIPFTFGSAFFSVNPYVRVLHVHKKDRILFQNPSESVTRLFDAFGVSFSYRMFVRPKEHTRAVIGRLANNP